MVIGRCLGVCALLLAMGSMVEGQQPASSFMTGVQPGNLKFTEVGGANLLQRNTSALQQQPGFFGRLFGGSPFTSLFGRSGPATVDIPKGGAPTNNLKMLSPVMPKNSTISR